MRWRWWLVGLFGVSAAIAIVRPEKAPPPDDGLAFSQDVVEAAVRPLLRDPQSAVFRDLSATKDRKIGTSPAGLVVCGRVNAKNGFGGYTGDKFFINFYGTRLVEIEPTPGTTKFIASWKKLCG